MGEQKDIGPKGKERQTSEAEPKFRITLNDLQRWQGDGWEVTLIYDSSGERAYIKFIPESPEGNNIYCEWDNSYCLEKAEKIVYLITGELYDCFEEGDGQSVEIPWDSSEWLVDSIEADIIWFYNRESDRSVGIVGTPAMFEHRLGVVSKAKQEPVLLRRWINNGVNHELSQGGRSLLVFTTNSSGEIDYELSSADKNQMVKTLMAHPIPLESLRDHRSETIEIEDNFVDTFAQAFWDKECENLRRLQEKSREFFPD